MSETQSPLAGLVLFIVCLAFAGTLVAGVHYFAIDLPQQKAVQAPENSENKDYACINECGRQVESCTNLCNQYEGEQKYSCQRDCKVAEYNCLRLCDRS
ncbi:MAG: hypothetical protein CVV30_04715 [Methanomicrobiales archaeon HGW-Methanomicrobiales-1]|jgi:archaellum component FlaG (FlaF/FlaG flagellin family)|nr:MAG: hypothetical protein CVV30_04715 [Methanomicrobiales archaeon HGW-Methanomicrobiales-1]